MDCFSLLASFRTYLHTIRASPQGGAFLVTSKSIPLSPVSEMCDIFSNKFVPSSSGKQHRAMAIASKVFGLSWTPGQQPEGRLPMSGTWVLLGSL